MTADTSELLTRNAARPAMTDHAALVDSLEKLATQAAGVSFSSLAPRVNEVLGGAGAVLEVGGAALLVLDERGKLRFVGTSDEPARLLEETEIRLCQGPALAAIANGEPLSVEDPRTSRYPSLAEHVVPAGVRAVLAVAVVVRDTQVGVLNVYRSRAVSWQAEHVTAGKALAALLALLLCIVAKADFQDETAQNVQRCPGSEGQPRYEPSSGRESAR